MVTPGSLFRSIHCLGYVSTSYPLYERVPFGTRPRASPFWYSSSENRSGVPSRNLFDTDTLPVRLGLRPPCRISRPPVDYGIGYQPPARPQVFIDLLLVTALPAHQSPSIPGITLRQRLRSELLSTAWGHHSHSPSCTLCQLHVYIVSITHRKIK